jgi:hydroxyethylthiazole kinase
MRARPNQDHAATAAAALDRVRDRRPKVHCLTSPVALELSANALLAVGAVPSLTGHASGVRGFVAATDALVVNLGMLDPEREDAARAATETAHLLGRPWLLDPVKVELSGDRLAFARRLLGFGPAVVRGNAAEIVALGGEDPARLAAATPTVVARTGAEDLVTDGTRHAAVANGSELMDRVTAVGCAASALAGAFLAVEPDRWAAIVAALLVFGVAGEVAAEHARGPGSFAVELLDALHRLDEPTLRGRARAW